MKLVRFKEGEKTRSGQVVGGDVIDLSGVKGLGSSMRQLMTDFRERAPRSGSSCSGQNQTTKDQADTRVFLGTYLRSGSG